MLLFIENKSISLLVKSSKITSLVEFIEFILFSGILLSLFFTFIFKGFWISSSLSLLFIHSFVIFDSSSLFIFIFKGGIIILFFAFLVIFFDSLIGLLSLELKLLFNPFSKKSSSSFN